MKLSLAALILASVSTLVSAASATLNPTKVMSIDIENQSGLVLQSAELKGYFSCSTNQTQGGGVTYTDTDEPQTLFQTGYELNQDSAVVTLQHMNRVSAVSPKKERLFNSQWCSANANLNLRFEGFNAPFQFFRPVASVKTTWKNVDLTKKFESELSGSFVLKTVVAGTTYDHETNGRKEYCRVKLFKKENGKLKDFGEGFMMDVACPN